MAKSKEYWQKRFEQLEDAQSRKGAEYFAELEKQYRKTAAAVQKDVETWFARFAVNNELTLQGARKLLNNDELEEFKWSVMEYIEKGRTLKYSDQWAKQLENASARWHMSRLEAIKIQMQNHVELLYGNEHDEISSLMTKVYTDGYYHTAYELQKGFNIGYDLMKLDENKISKVLSKPWAADGSNFSSRIWKHKAQLVNELHNNLTRAIIRGQNPKVVTDAIAKRFNVSKGQAGRLVMTETAFFHSASNRDCYKDLGVEQYEILATLDKKTSDICQALDGKVFSMSEYAVGVTAPPFHQWCRTTTVPYFDDEFELDSERAARGEDGKVYYVPADMKYGDWKKAFVDGGSKKDLTPIEKILEETSDRVRVSAPKMNDESASQTKAVNKNGDEISFDIDNMSDERKAMVTETITELSSIYDTNLVHVNATADLKGKNRSSMGIDGTMRLNKGDKKDVVVHEFAHSIATTKADELGITNNAEFWKEMRKLHREYKADVHKNHNHIYKLDPVGYADDINEFLAEGFTASYMNDESINSKYPNKIRELIDKYFKKDTLEDIVEETTKITKKTYNSDYGIVDRKLVNSKAYHDKFENLTRHKSVNETIYQESMKMLEHRDNTPYEDLIVIDSGNGKVVARFTESTKPGKVSLTAEQVDTILNYDGNVILLHNHPNSSRASYTDIRNLKVKNIDATIATGHDGSVYYVSELDQKFDIDIFWDEVYNSYKDVCKDDVLANRYATDDLYDLGVFKVESR